MKILRLSLNNLASLAGVHHIHFDQQPLAHAGLIAITGKTGAGKSTLLDAMCLALYDEVPRLRGAAGSIKDAGGKDISIKDSKNILRRGTTSGFAELEFIALDGKRYQARWDIRRARNKVDGNLKVERAITCLDDQKVLNHKISEATPLIEKLIGLSFEQFTRAVLLAQSEVGAFLKAKDHERADLLEYLTNSHIFSLVSIKAAEKNSQIKQQRAELENVIGHIQILSEDEIQQLQQQQKELALQLQSLQSTEKLLENEKKWHLERDQLYAEVLGKKEIYDVQLDAINKSAAQKQLLQQLDDFQAIREKFVQRARLQPLKAQTLAQQTEFMTGFVQLQQQTQQQQTALQQVLDTQKQFEQQRLDLKPHLEQALKLDHEINTVSEQYKKLNAEKGEISLSQVEPLKKSLEQEHNAWASLVSQQQQIGFNLSQSDFLQCFDQEPQSILNALHHYAEQYAALNQQHPEILQQPLSVLEQQQQHLAQQLQGYSEAHANPEQLAQSLKTTQQQKEHLRAKLTKLQQQAQQLQQLSDAEKHIAQLKNNVSIEQTALQTIEHNIQRLSSEKTAQESAFTQLQQVFETQRLLHNENVQHLRAQLKPNEACMVCGSQAHPFVEDHTALEQGLLQLQEQQLQQAKQKLEQTLAQLQQAQIEHSKRHAVLEQQQLRLHQLQQSNQEQLQQICLDLQQAGYILENDSLISLQKYVGLNTTQLEQQLEQQQVLEQQQTELLDQWRKDLQQSQQLQLNLERRIQLEQRIQPIMQLLPERYQNSAAISWQAELQVQLKQRIEQLNAQKQIELSITQAKQKLEKIELQYQSALAREEHLSKEIEQHIKQGTDLRQQLAALTEQYAGKPYRVAAEWRNHLDETTQRYAEDSQQQREKTTKMEQALNQANLKQQQFISELQHIENALAQVQQDIQQWQLQSPTVTTENIETWLQIDLNQHQMIRQTLNNQQQLLENAKTAWQLLEERYQAHLKYQPEHDFAALENLLAQLVLEKNSQQDALNELDAKLRINTNNQSTYAKYQTQIEQIKAEEYRWGRIYDLIGHKEGTKFQKIAQEHHLDILVEYANQQLQPLAPRYQLHRIPDSLSLAIIDLDMNSEVRPVLSLSGGETFLVSLALALAIANMASGSMKLESLFIDEGFGTLDPASLHMVMNALDHLQSQGRKVVLISHIQEMHERIPVQIQVKAVGAGASQVKIIS